MKRILIILTELSLKQIIKFFLRWEPTFKENVIFPTAAIYPVMGSVIVILYWLIWKKIDNSNNTRAYSKYQKMTASNVCDCNWTQTHNHLVQKRILNHLDKLASLAKWLSICLRTKWLCVRVQLQSPKLQISRLIRASNSLTFRQLESVDSFWNAYVIWQEHTLKLLLYYNRDIENKHQLQTKN